MKQMTLCIAIIGCLHGCSTLSPSDDARIASLKAASLPIEKKQKPIDHRSEAMINYRDFLSSSPDNKLAPEALRRLADLNMDNELTRQIDGDTTQIHSKATELYKNLLTQHPEHVNNDSATYQLARAYEQQGNNESVFQTLTEYTKHFPDADNIDEAHFRRGEYLFSLGKFEKSDSAYQQVIINNTGSDFFQPSLYKSGWSQFKLNNIETALNTFVALLDENLSSHQSSILPDSIGRAEQERIQDTLRVIGLSFSYLGNADLVEKYFMNHGRKSFEPLVYASVAELHLSKQRYTDAADTYQKFAVSHPDHREAPLFQSHVIRVYQEAGFEERVLKEKESFTRNYLPGSQYWQEHDIKQSPDVVKLVKTYLDDISHYHHALAQKTKNPIDYQTAINWYELYFQGFSENPGAPATNFLFAELLLESGNTRKAITEYERTAYDYGVHDKASEAGYAALLAHNQYESSLNELVKKTSWHREGIDKALRFAQTFPTHKNAIAVKTRAAEQLYALQEFELTIQTARSIISTDHIPSDILLSNWTLVAHSYFETHQYENSELSYQQVLLLLSQASEQKEAIINRLAASIYKQGETARDANHLTDAIKHFNRVALVTPAAKIAATARYDAATAYITLNRLAEAIQTLESWRVAYPGNALRKEATGKLAYLYRETQQPLKAANEYESVSHSEVDVALQRTALWSAATLYLDAKASQKAIVSYQSYVDRFPSPEPQAMEARAMLVKLYSETRNPTKTRYWQQQIIAHFNSTPALQNDRGRLLAATSQLALAGPYKEKYLSISLTEPLQENLLAKKKHLQSAITAFTLAAKYNVADITTQATYETGNIYADFSKAILNSERPAGLSGEELEQYNILLEEEAYPIEEQAIEIHETNIKYLADGHYNQWTKNSLKQLAELIPGRYNKIERVETYVSQ